VRRDVKGHERAAVGKPFDYKTQTKGGACADGYEPLEFSMYIGLAEGDYGRASYVMMPHRSNDDGDNFGGPSRTATLMGGSEAQLVANTWQLMPGVPLSDDVTLRGKRLELISRTLYAQFPMDLPLTSGPASILL
jgi:hypothetical protein